MQQAAPSIGPTLILLFGWGMGLILHFLGVFVFANLSAFNQGNFYPQEQTGLMPQPEEYNFDSSHLFAYSWPPPESGKTQIEANSKRLGEIKISCKACTGCTTALQLIFI